MGKQANCQVSVEVVASDGEIAAPMAGRLYLPESWAGDAPRRAEAGVPESVEFQTKPAIALELIRQIVADGVNAMRGPGFSALVITHYQRLLDHIVPDRVHVLMDGRIVKSGPASLALELEAEGYAKVAA